MRLSCFFELKLDVDVKLNSTLQTEQPTETATENRKPKCE